MFLTGDGDNLAILEGFKRLIVEDFDSKDRAMISKVAYSVNSFADDVLNALNKNLTINDNLLAKETTITLTVDATGTPTSKTTFTTNLGTASTGMLVIDAFPVSTNTPPSGSITAISVGVLTQITVPSHGLLTGTQVIISGSDSTPSINGSWSVGVIDKNTFSIPFSVTTAGTRGTFKLASYPTGTPFISYSENSGTITILNVTNLPPNQQFTLSLIVFT